MTEEGNTESRFAVFVTVPLRDRFHAIARLNALAYLHDVELPAPPVI
jgi:hypothetical protein